MNMIFPIFSSLQGGRCGIYGVNCPEWVISMEVFSLHVHVHHSFDMFWLCSKMAPGKILF